MVKWLVFFSLNGEKLEHMYVHPDHQNVKVGSTLLDQARVLSPARMQLHTFARNHGARASTSVTVFE